MKYTIDRIEGSIAVCEREDRTMHDIELKHLPFDAREGLSFAEVNGTYRAIRSDRSKRIKNLMDELWK